MYTCIWLSLTSYFNPVMSGRQ